MRERAGTARRSVRHLMERWRGSSEHHEAHRSGATQTGAGGRVERQGLLQDRGWFPNLLYSLFLKHDKVVSKNVQPLYAKFLNDFFFSINDKHT